MNIRKRVHDYTAEEYAQLMDTNVAAVFELCRLAHPLLKKSAGGSIVNIGSVAGQVPIGTTAVYGMSKASVFQLTRSFAKEWGPDGIRVNTVSPWFTRTERTAIS